MDTQVELNVPENVLDPMVLYWSWLPAAHLNIRHLMEEVESGCIIELSHSNGEGVLHRFLSWNGLWFRANRMSGSDAWLARWSGISGLEVAWIIADAGPLARYRRWQITPEDASAYIYRQP